MRTEDNETTEIRLYRQKFNGIGATGAVLFLGAPTLAAVLFSTSVPAFLQEASSSYAYRPQDELYSHWIYVLLLVIALTGLVMMVVGRDLVGYPSQMGSLPEGADQDSPPVQHSPREKAEPGVKGIWRKIAEN